MHIKYTTLGFVLQKNEQGESNRYFSIFTREFGKILASAQSVRDVRSKLRMNLGEFSFSEVSLVRGKRMWKITGAKKLSNFYDSYKNDKQKLAVCLNSVSLLNRLLHGEEKNEPLFDLFFNAFLYLSDNSLGEEETKNFEVVLVLNILHLLGYVGDRAEFNIFIDNPSWHKDILQKMGLVRSQALFEINRSLEESQL